MKLIVIALLNGVLFGGGLALSQMIKPDKVLNFLDVAGQWDPSLIFVMLGALTVTTLCFRLILKQANPIFGEKFYLASNTVIDTPLIFGATLFGAGWGISGYCPGPSIAGLGVGNFEAVIMVISLYAGMAAHRFYQS